MENYFRKATGKPLLSQPDIVDSYVCESQT